MTDEQIALSRRLVACKGWCWLPGMMRLRATPPGMRDYLLREGRVLDGGDTWDYAAWPVIPDLTDAATRGCLLALVREAWGDPKITVVPRGATVWAVVYAGWLHKKALACCRTEAEALVAALESAP
jgi:hypothetical protein